MFNANEFMEVVDDLRNKEKIAEGDETQAVVSLREYCSKTYGEALEERKALIGFVNNILDIIAEVDTSMPVADRPNNSIKGRKDVSCLNTRDDPEMSRLEFCGLVFKCDFEHGRLTDVDLSDTVRSHGPMHDPRDVGYLAMDNDDVSYWIESQRYIDRWAQDTEAVVRRLYEGLMRVKNTVAARSSRAKGVVEALKAKSEKKPRVQDPDMPCLPDTPCHEMPLAGIASDTYTLPSHFGSTFRGPFHPPFQIDDPFDERDLTYHPSVETGIASRPVHLNADLCTRLRMGDAPELQRLQDRVREAAELSRSRLESDLDQVVSAAIAANSVESADGDAMAAMAATAAADDAATADAADAATYAVGTATYSQPCSGEPCGG